jgi:hypothetical protein
MIGMLQDGMQALKTAKPMRASTKPIISPRAGRRLIGILP